MTDDEKHSSADCVILEMMVIHDGELTTDNHASSCTVFLLSAVWMNTAAVAWDEPGFLWSIFTSYLKRMSNSSARLLPASSPNDSVFLLLLLHLLLRLEV